MWSSEEALRPDLRLSSVLTPARVRGAPDYPRWSPHSYLSFGSERSYTRGIIAYCLGSRVLGLTSLTEPSHSIGFTVGYPFFLALQPGERIVSTWVCRATLPPGPRSVGPYFLVSLREAPAPFSHLLHSR